MAGRTTLGCAVIALSICGVLPIQRGHCLNLPVEPEAALPEGSGEEQWRSI